MTKAKGHITMIKNIIGFPTLIMTFESMMVNKFLSIAANALIVYLMAVFAPFMAPLVMEEYCREFNILNYYKL